MKARGLKMIRVASLVITLVMFVVSLSGCSQRRSEGTQLAPSELAEEVRSALAEPAYLDRNTMRADHGSVEGYLREALQISEADTAALRMRLLE